MGSFVLKNIEMTLDPESIQRAVDEVVDFKSDFKHAMNLLCGYLLRNGVRIARQKLEGYGISDGSALSATIRFEVETGETFEGHVVAGYPGDHLSEDGKYSNVSYAVFVEYGFGTGNYYRRDGSRINSGKALRHLMKTGGIARASGRTKNHPSGLGRYRAASEFKMMSNKNRGEFRGWVYKDRVTGKFYTSEGQPPKPFMYNTYLELMAKAERDGGRLLGMYIGSGGV